PWRRRPLAAHLLARTRGREAVDRFTVTAHAELERLLLQVALVERHGHARLAVDEHGADLHVLLARQRIQGRRRRRHANAAFEHERPGHETDALVGAETVDVLPRLRAAVLDTGDTLDWLAAHQHLTLIGGEDR